MSSAEYLSSFKGKRLERFFRNIKPDCSGCWIWTGDENNKGSGFSYGVFNKVGAHRIIFQLVNKVVLNRNQFVCHKCDNPKCCNPEHLFVGSAKDNTRDAVKKGRSGVPEKHSKLTWEQVWEIRESKLPKKEIAKMYGIHWRHVYDILRGKNWKL